MIVPAARYHQLNGSEVQLRQSDYFEIIPNYYEYAGVVGYTDATTYAQETSARRLTLDAIHKGVPGGNIRSPYEQWADGVHPTPLVCNGY